jgi:hypothetical protein
MENLWKTLHAATFGVAQTQVRRQDCEHRPGLARREALLIPVLKRHPLPDKGGLLGALETSDTLALSPRMLEGHGGYFESWDAAIFEGSKSFLLTFGICKASDKEQELSFCKADLFTDSGDQTTAQIGTEGVAASSGSAEIEIAAAQRRRHRRVAIASGISRFDLEAYLGGSGSASLGQWGTEGRLKGGDTEILWNGKFEIHGDSLRWNLLTPQFRLGPRRWMCYSSAQAVMGFSGEISKRDSAVENIECGGSPVVVMRRWGSAHPLSWARIAGTFVLEGSQRSDDSPQRLFATGVWVKMGRLGVLGPPAPKTFFSLHPSPELASHLALNVGPIAFNALPRALLCSSYVVFPKWEARLLGGNVAASVIVDVSGLEPYQSELPDPEGLGSFVAQFPHPPAEIVLEVKKSGSWKHAATLKAENAVVDFGGREALPYLPLLPKEYALGMHG